MIFYDLFIFIFTLLFIILFFMIFAVFDVSLIACRR